MICFPSEDEKEIPHLDPLVDKTQHTRPHGKAGDVDQETGDVFEYSKEVVTYSQQPRKRQYREKEKETEKPKNKTKKQRV